MLRLRLRWHQPVLMLLIFLFYNKGIEVHIGTITNLRATTDWFFYLVLAAIFTAEKVLLVDWLVPITGINPVAGKGISSEYVMINFLIFNIPMIPMAFFNDIYSICTLLLVTSLVADIVYYVIIGRQRRVTT